MGEFIATSAFRHRSVDEVVEAICAFAAQHAARAEVVNADPVDNAEDVAHVTPPRNGWTVVVWPLFFVGDPPLYAELSRIARTLVSTVQVYDSDCWEHLLLNDGQVLDQFASDPLGHAVTAAPTAAEIEQLREVWRGNPDVLAVQFGVSSDVIRPYFEHRSEVTHDRAATGARAWLQRWGFGARRDRQETIKAFPDDGHDLRDTWVFTDFWRRMGIEYPDGEDASDRRIRFSPQFWSYTAANPSS